MWNLLFARLVAMAVVAPPLSASPVQAPKPAATTFLAYPIDGDPAAGRLVGLAKNWRFTLDGAERIGFKGQDLVALRRKDAPHLSAPVGAEVLLANGDRIRATAHHATQEVLRVSSERMGAFEIPLERVLAIILAGSPDPAAHEQLVRSLQSSKRKQDVLILANGDELAGTFLGLDEDQVRLERAGGAGDIQRTGLRAIAFSSELIAFAEPKELYAKIVLADGSELSMLDAWLDGPNLTGQTVLGPVIKFPVEQLHAIEFRNGRLTYLSDLQPAAYRHIPYLSLTYAWERDRSVLGHPLMIRGQLYRKGIGVHSWSELSYDLKGRYQRFDAVAGIDDETGGKGSVIFRVLVDGKPAWESDLVTGQSAPQPVQVDLKGADRLTLIVEFGTLGDVQDDADWAEARLVR